MACKFSLHRFLINQVLYNIFNLAQDLFSANSNTSTYFFNSSIHSGNIIGARTSVVLLEKKDGIASKTHLNSNLYLSQAALTCFKL